MGKTVEITVSDGYTIRQSLERIPLETAFFLQTKRQHRYTSARREGNWAILEKHRILCPCCGFGVPAYERFWNPKFNADRDCRVTWQEISNWMMPQVSLFSEGEDTLVFNRVAAPEEFSCPKCQIRSAAAKGGVTVTIGEEEGKAWISSIVGDMKQILELMMGNGRSAVSLRFPLREKVTFDIKKGTVELQITDKEGKALHVRELTNGGNNGPKPAAFRWLSSSNPVGKRFARVFRSVYGEQLPFGKRELGVVAYMGMTRFSHYSRDFYDAIPYNLKTGALNDDFLPIAGRLSDAAVVPELFDSSGLPAVKSVRRLFFANPGFFFYLKEAEALAAVFEDTNVFVRVFSQQNIYDLLVFLHMYPGALVFFMDCAHRQGQVALAKRLESDFKNLARYAIRYCAMSPAGRTEERKRWKGNQWEPEPEQYYSVPMRPGFNSIPDGQTVDGYTFRFLRSRFDYAEAARGLRNCLESWQSESNPVVVVKKGDVYKAAVEVRNNTVVQQWGIRNTPVENEPPLEAAIEKWKVDNKLTNAKAPSYELDEDDEEELPF